MFGGFITGGVTDAENKRASANRFAQKLPKFEEVDGESRADRLQRWKRFKAAQEVRAPESQAMPPPPNVTLTTFDQSAATLVKSRRANNNLVKSKIDRSQAPFRHLDNAAKAQMARSKSMFVMTFSPGNGLGHTHSAVDTTTDEESLTVEPVETNDDESTAEFRFEDLSTTDLERSKHTMDTEQVNSLQIQLREAADRMKQLESMCKTLEQSCDTKEDELATSRIKCKDLEGKLTELEDTKTIEMLTNEINQLKAKQKQTQRKLEQTQKTYRNAESAANVMEKAMSKLRAKVETSAVKQKEMSVQMEELSLANERAKEQVALWKKRHVAAVEEMDRKVSEARTSGSHEREQALADDLAAERNKVTALEAQLAEHIQNSQAAQRSIADKDAALARADKTTAELRSVADDAKAEAAKHRVECDATNAKLEELSAAWKAQLDASKEVQTLVQAMRAKNTTATKQLSEVTKRAEEAEKALAEMQATYIKKECEIMQINDSYTAACSENEALQGELHDQKEETKKWRDQVENALTQCQTATTNAKTWESQIVYYKQKAIADESLRRKLHNSVMELKGNIRVFCRVRPLLAEERVLKDGETTIHKVFEFPDLDVEQRSITHIKPGGKKYDGSKAANKAAKFTYDRVFTPRDSQETVYGEVGDMVQSAADGYRVCIFAYGQTGSGKTHTMHGPLHGDQRGIIPRAAAHVFEYCEKLEAQGWTSEISVSMVEIYNESLRDLMNTDSDASLEIHHHLKPAEGEDADTVVDGLSEHTVTSAGEVLNLLKKAMHYRTTAATKCNTHSSRSHTVFTMKISGFDTKEGRRRVGKLNLVDLAGSERLSESGSASNQKLLKEAQSINKSLSTLGNVIAAVASQNGHVPFRDSKLTYLLQRSLGGDCKALMFCNLSPQTHSTGESLCSLRFAKKVNACERKYLYNK